MGRNILYVSSYRLFLLKTGTTEKDTLKLSVVAGS